jgi:preprotein translocase subunit SecG
MVSLLLTINAIICVALIILILLQRSDPASGGMFGGTGGGGGAVIRNPLARPTAFLALAFLVLSLLLAYLNKGSGHESSVMEGAAPAPLTVPVETSPTLPAPALLPGGATVSSPTAP